MKKFVTFFLVALLVMASFAMTVQADAVNAMSAGSASVAYNPDIEQTVTVNYTVSGEFANFYAELSHDGAVSIMEITGGGVVANPAAGKVTYASAVNQSSITFSVVYSVPAGTDVGSYAVGFKAVRMANQDGVSAENISVSGGSIKVYCDHAWGEWTVVTPSTCAVAGTESRTCSVCSETESRDLPLAEHTWGEWTVTTAATCTAEGEETRICSVCDKSETRKTEKAPHTVTVDANGKPVYGKNDSEHWYICSVCEAAFDHDDHFVYTQADGYNVCICGHQVSKIDDGKDDEPENGDITGQIAFAAIAVAAVVTTAGVCVFKRRIVK